MKLENRIQVNVLFGMHSIFVYITFEFKQFISTSTQVLQYRKDWSHFIPHFQYLHTSSVDGLINIPVVIPFCNFVLLWNLMLGEWSHVLLWENKIVSFTSPLKFITAYKAMWRNMLRSPYGRTASRVVASKNISFIF